MLDRALGMYPISIATSLAIESITHTGEHASKRGVPEVMDMECLLINLRTLIRNVLGSLPTNERMLVNSESVYEAIVSDVEHLKDAVLELNPNIKVEIYYCTHKSIDTKYKLWNRKKFTAPKAVFETSVEDGVINRAVDDGNFQLTVFDCDLSGGYETTIITHQPIDLLSSKAFRSLRLLESHTGAIKDKVDWYTKLNVSDKSVVIPFYKSMYCIFGDKTMFSGQELIVRRRVMEISKKFNWNKFTTWSKVRSNIAMSNEPLILEFINRVE